MFKFRYLQHLFLAALVCSTLAYYEEKVDGEYVLGAMFPVHKAEKNSSSNATCGELNWGGVAAAEAFRLAVDTINKRSPLASGIFPRIFGYDLKDTCSSSQGAMDIAYNFNLRFRQYRKRKLGSKPVSVVIASFDKSERAALQLLTIERLPQLSYTSDNIKLSPNVELKKGDMLLSAYPGDSFKVIAVIDAMKKLKIEYFTAVVSDDANGKDGAVVIQKAFTENPEFCSSKIYVVTSKPSATSIVSEIGKNPLATAVLLHLDKEKSFWVFAEAKRQNLTKLIWFSTRLWNAMDLQPYLREVEGLVSVGNKQQDPTGFKLHIDRLRLPYNGNDFLKYVFIKLGGRQDCLKANASLSNELKKQCEEKHQRIKTELSSYSAKISYLIDAVFIFEEGLSKMLDEGGGISLLDAMKAVEFTSSLTQNIIQFNTNGILLDVVNIVYNMQVNAVTSAGEMIRAGRYNNKVDPKLYLNNGVLKWKNGSKAISISKCSPDCGKGWQRILPQSGPKCCWSCTRCPNQSASVDINSATCRKCDAMSVANPPQTSCVKFKTTSFRWFDPVGEFMIFLITAGLCATFFTLGIFSQNRDCSVVKSADYKMMTFVLFGLALCFFTPVPLLLEPSSATCISYVIMFNFGLTIPLAVLFIKSAAVRHRFFDENLELVNGSLGSMPHLVIVGIIIAIQAVILAIGINFTATSVVYYPTEQWDLKYAECSYVKNAVFWAAFGYNVVVSIVMNIASCNSVKMKEDFKEQKWICITTCTFYLVSYLFVTCIYSVYGANVVEAASVIIILFGFVFIFAYFVPKLRLILFHQKPKPEFGPDGQPLISKEEPSQKALTPHMSGVEGLKKHEKHKILGMKVKEGPSTA